MKLLKLAARIAQRGCDHRTFYLGAVAKRADGAIVHARNEATATPNPGAHAEARVLKRAGKNATVYVARVTKGQREIALARPCAKCMGLMRAYKVKKVYYTIGPNEWDWSSETFEY